MLPGMDYDCFSVIMGTKTDIQSDQFPSIAIVSE